MSYEAQLDIPSDVRPSDVADELHRLGYRKVKPSLWFGTPDVVAAFAWEDHTDYRSHSGVYGHVSGSDSRYRVYLRTDISASYWDIAKQNDTIRHLRHRYRTRFISDYGKNRYFPLPRWKPTPRESGCYLALERLNSGLSAVELYLASRKFPDSLRDGIVARTLGSMNPWVLSNSLLLPYLVALVEDYLRTTFLVLLRYSDKLEAMLKEVRISQAQLMRIAHGSLTVQEAIADSVSFQHLDTVNSTFRTVQPVLDFHGLLQSPFHKRRLSLFDSITMLIDMRHAFIHRGVVSESLNDASLRRALGDIEEVAQRVYRRLGEVYDWDLNFGPLFSRQFRPSRRRPVQT